EELRRDGARPGRAEATREREQGERGRRGEEDLAGRLVGAEAEGEGGELGRHEDERQRGGRRCGPDHRPYAGGGEHEPGGDPERFRADGQRVEDGAAE